MSEFFQHYPQISYDITGAKPAKYKTAINAMVRAKLKNIVADDVVRYFGYSIPEAERPDITSYKIYGDVKFTWLIFLINDIHDPIYDWQLGTREFVTFIKSKYGSITVAKNNIHHYERIIRDRVEATGTTEAIPQYKIEVDLTTYNDLGSEERNVVYSFNWEVDRNEAKRDIKLISPDYVSSIFSEHEGKFE